MNDYSMMNMQTEAVCTEYPAQARSDGKTAHISFEVDFELLCTALSATLECHADGGKELLICPQYQLEAKPFTLAVLLGGINEMFKNLAGEDALQLNVESVFGQLREYMNDLSLDTLRISIVQVFLHITKPAVGKTELEYAFSLKITSTDSTVPKDFTFASLNSVSFGIWNTENRRILGDMGLLSIAERLS